MQSRPPDLVDLMMRHFYPRAELQYGCPPCPFDYELITGCPGGEWCKTPEGRAAIDHLRRAS
jgi:hypothetical protein